MASLRPFWSLYAFFLCVHGLSTPFCYLTTPFHCRSTPFYCLVVPLHAFFLSFYTFLLSFYTFSLPFYAFLLVVCLRLCTNGSLPLFYAFFFFSMPFYCRSMPFYCRPMSNEQGKNEQNTSRTGKNRVASFGKFLKKQQNTKTVKRRRKTVKRRRKTVKRRRRTMICRPQKIRCRDIQTLPKK